MLRVPPYILGTRATSVDVTNHKAAKKKRYISLPSGVYSLKLEVLS